MIAAELASRPALPRTVLDQVVRHADGVPLFVEEVIRCWLSGAPRGRRPERGLRLEIPSGLRDLLTARLTLVRRRAGHRPVRRGPGASSATSCWRRRASTRRCCARTCASGWTRDFLRGAACARRATCSARPHRDAAYESMVRPTARRSMAVSHPGCARVPRYRAPAPLTSWRASERGAACGRRRLLEARRRPHERPAARTSSRSGLLSGSACSSGCQRRRAHEARGRPLRVSGRRC
jgi:hypothetical protein